MLASVGCAQLPSDTVSLAVDRSPAPQPWPRLFPRSSRAAESPSSAKSEPPPKSSDQPDINPSPSASERTPALAGVDQETRHLIEQELASIDSDEERVRLMTYLATVPPDRRLTLLKSHRRERMQAQSSKSQFVHPLAASGTSDPNEAKRVPELELASHEVGESASHPALLGEIEEIPHAAGTPSGDALPPVGPQEQAAPAPAEAPAQPPHSAFERLKQWDPRKSWGLGRSVPEENPAPVETAETAAPDSLLSPFARMTGRKIRTETPAAAVPEMAPGRTAPSQGDLDATYLEEELHRLVSLMEAKAERLEPGSTFAERDAYIRQHVLLRMLYLMENEPQLAQQAIPGIDDSTQEFWTSTMWGLSNYFDSETTPDPSDRAALALQQLRAATAHLQPSARLELHGLVFCEGIDGFGVYQPFERNVFRPGQPVLLYGEVRNFQTELSAAGQYRTVLRSTIEILRNGVDGELVERKQFDPTEDISRSPRTDYFHSYKLDLPNDLTPGPHTLRLTLEDQLSGKIASSTINFLVR
jgi:hypothetical protein